MPLLIWSFTAFWVSVMFIQIVCKTSTVVIMFFISTQCKIWVTKIVSGNIQLV